MYHSFHKTMKKFSQYLRYKFSQGEQKNLLLKHKKMTDHKFFPKKLEHVDLIETKPARYLSIVRL